MGYAKQGQNTKGIHVRQFSRAFIFESEDDGQRAVFVSTDTGMMGQLVKMEVWFNPMDSDPDPDPYPDQ